MSWQFPQGIEVLVKKASVDAEFKALLLAERAEAAEAIGLGLEPEEAAMLAAVPAAQLEAIIGQTTVPQEHRRAFLGKAAAAMLAALAATDAGLASGGIGLKGIQPDRPPKSPNPREVRGIRPDVPPEPAKLPSRAEAFVIDVIAKTLGLRPDEVARRSALVRDLDATPQQQATIRLELERQFRITIPADTFEGLVTVGDLIEYVDFQAQFEPPVIDLLARELGRRRETITVATRLREDLRVTQAQRVRLKRKLAGEFHIHIFWDEFKYLDDVGEVIGCVGKAVRLREEARAQRKEPDPPGSQSLPPRASLSFGIRPGPQPYRTQPNPPKWRGAAGGIRPGSGGGAF
jgi:acyl carrier protein